MKVVLDANVLLAAFATRGLCEAVLDACLDAHEIFISGAMLKEVTKNLAGKFKVPPPRIKEVTDLISAEFHFVEPSNVPENACRDADDVVVLGTAVAASADCIVTGDKDLLVLQKYESILILSPRVFYDRLKPSP